jgi:hypothetical protein
MFLLISQFTFLSIDNNTTVSADSINYHVYVCNGVNASAAEGASSTGSFDGIGELFSSTDYNSISFDNENYVSDSSDLGMHQYHEFRFTIDEDVEDITRIDITWKGYGGDDLSNYGYSLWVMESGNYIKKASGTKSSKDTLVKSYTVSSDDINNLISGGSLYIGVQSDYEGEAKDPPFAGVVSLIKSYYVEVSITYNAQNDECQGLVVSNPSSVVEMESFDVTVTSCSIPIENALVGFNGLNLSTNEFGVVSFSAPEVESDTSFDIFVYRAGYVVNVSLVTVLDNSSQDVPVLDISAPSSVFEGVSFTVTVTSDNVAVQGAIVNFSGFSYSTTVQGTVTFSAPYVDEDASFNIVAYKPGYISTMDSIIILDNSSQDVPVLDISAPSSVFEGASFTVTITSEGILVKDVLVSFNGVSSSTNSEGKVIFTAPFVGSKAYFTIIASKSGYVSDSKTIGVLDLLETNVVLISPNGGESVSDVVDILWDVVNPVSSASISLFYKVVSGSWVSIADGLSISSDSFGWDTSVVDDGSYLLKLLLMVGDVVYEDVSDSYFTISNFDDIQRGWVYGKITDINTFNPIKNAEVCLKLSEESLIYRCVYTDEQGNFNLSSVLGNYLITVSKEGYQLDAKTVQINKDEGTLVNFELEKTQFQEEKVSDNYELFFNYIIKDTSNENSAGAKIDVDTRAITVFTDFLDMSIEKQTLNNLELKVSAPNTTKSKIIFIKASSAIFTDVQSIDDFNVEYDGNNIERKSIDYVISNIDNSSQPVWTIFSSFDKDEKETYYFAILVPSFSEHNINIFTSFQEVFGGLTALIYNILFIIVIALVIVGITIYRIKH